MIECKAEVTELEPEAFEFVERLNADVDIDLFSKTSISVMGDEHHRHPIVAGVTRNLFRATAYYIFHKVFFFCRTLKGQAERLPRATKNRYGLMGEKNKDATFHLRVLRCCFRPRSILSRNYKYFYLHEEDNSIVKEK